MKLNRRNPVLKTLVVMKDMIMNTVKIHSFWSDFEGRDNSFTSIWWSVPQRKTNTEVQGVDAEACEAIKGRQPTAV